MVSNLLTNQSTNIIPTTFILNNDPTPNNSLSFTVGQYIKRSNLRHAHNVYNRRFIYAKSNMLTGLKNHVHACHVKVGMTKYWISKSK